MKSTEFFQEEKIIVEYEKVYKDLCELNLIVKHPVWKLNEEQTKAYQEAQTKQAELTTALTNLGYPSEATQLKVKTLIWQLQSTIEGLMSNKFGNVLDSQGLMISNGFCGIYWYVAEDIKGAFLGFHNSIRIANYIHTPNSKFDSTELVNYLSEFKKLLITNPPKDYIELQEIILAVFAHLTRMVEDYTRKYVHQNEY